MKKKLIGKIRSLDYRHYICLIITLCFLLLSVFYFKYGMLRILESLIDLKTSFIYYLNELFELDIKNTITINDFSKAPFKMPFNLPNTWEEFKLSFTNYWKVFFTFYNFKNYLKLVFNLLYNLSKIISILLPFIIAIAIFFRLLNSKTNNDYNKDSKFLIVFKKLEKVVFARAKNWLVYFIDFIKIHRFYVNIWLFIWAYNFNLITISLEFIAYYLYFVSSFNLLTLYIQFLKLLLDLSISLDFIPLIVWLFIAFAIINLIRRKIGYLKLNHMERKNRGFINERPIVLMLCGTMGSKKTTIITDIALSQEIMLRNKAFEKLLEIDLKFPNFPWINLENNIKWAMNHHLIYNLATCRKYIHHITTLFTFSLYADSNNIKSIKRHLKKHYNFSYKNLFFDYDYTRYGLEYDNKLYVESLFDCLKNYTQLFFIYIIQSSLIISNYSIRVDNIIDDLGNFPLWNSDLFKRDSRLIDSYSRHSHILDFDSLRLGKKVLKNNERANSFEFGVINITEIGKERGNNLELQQVKKNDESANQKNDLFNAWLKMVRHSATVDNFPFVKIISDEQRPESWGADARDLCEIVHIEECSDFKLSMPLFEIEDLVITSSIDKFINSYSDYRYRRSDNTLTMYLYHNLISFFNKYHRGIYNTFGYYKLKVLVEKGTQDGTIKKQNYYLMSKKIYSKRFSTDCFSEFFNAKALKSKIGINDLLEFRTEKASFEEMLKENSYFFNDLVNLKNKDKE